MSLIFEKIVLIDDDVIVNHLNKTIIRNFFRPHNIDIVCFDRPEEGLAYIAEGSSQDNADTILFLDINMPVLSGWDVLEGMCKLEEEKVKHLTTYILSSSIDPVDRQKALDHPLVTGFLSKPLSSQIRNIFSQTLAQNMIHAI